MVAFRGELAVKPRSRVARRLSLFFGVSVICLAPLASADIVNTVHVTGKAVRGELVVDQDTSVIPLEKVAGRLVVSQKPGGLTKDRGRDPGQTDAGDYLWYRLLLTNVGNAPVTNVNPNVPVPKFGGYPGTGAAPRVAFDPDGSTTASPDIIAPGETMVLIVSYIFTEIDLLRGAQRPDGLEIVAPPQDGNSECECGPTFQSIPANPRLAVTNRAELGERNGTIGDGRAAIGDIVRYTYTVENVGNVAVRDVVLKDVHEEGEHHSVTLSSIMNMVNEELVREGPLGNDAPSRDAVRDGKWDVLQPGAVIRFTYSRVVSEAEFYAQ